MATGDDDEIEEERRLLYVALTRAARRPARVRSRMRYYRRPRGLEDPHTLRAAHPVPRARGRARTLRGDRSRRRCRRPTPSSTSRERPTSTRSSPGSGRSDRYARAHARAPDAVLLDLYDTLVWSDWWGLAGAARARAGRHASRHVGPRRSTSTRPARSVGANADADADLAAVIARRRGRRPTPSSIARLRRTRARAHRGRRRPPLRRLAARSCASSAPAGSKTALVSNCSHNTRPLVDRLGLEEEFDPVDPLVRGAGEEAGPRDLPDRRSTRAGRSRTPARAVFVDDQTAVLRRRDGAGPRRLPDPAPRARPPRAARAERRTAYRDDRDLTALL